MKQFYSVLPRCTVPKLRVSKEKHILYPPKYGWTHIEFNEFKGPASYTTDVPIDVLTGILKYYTAGSAVICFDAEGWEFYMVLADCTIYIIESKSDDVQFIDKLYSEHDNFTKYIKQIVKDIEDYIDDWASFPACAEERGTTEKYKAEIQQLLEQVHSRVFV